MTYNNQKIGAFIIPTGIGASIGGYAGDGGAYAREFAKKTNLIVNPNVVNAGCFSAITDNMYYTEGYTLDSFFKGEISLIPSTNNKIGLIYDKAIPENVINIHLNTQNAINVVYGINCTNYEITEENVGVEFYINESGVSVGNVKNISAIGKACEKLLQKGCDAIGIVCLFEDPENENDQYSQGNGVDPVGGVEAIISHYISKKYKVPCAHSPAFTDYSIYPDIVNPKAAAEYITPTFLPCIIFGLNNAPKISENLNEGISIKNLDYLVMPYNSLGSTPVMKAIENNIPVYAVKENSTVLDVTKKHLYPDSNVIEIETYKEVLSKI